MPRDTLQFVHADSPPALDGVRVFDSRTRSFLGTEFTFRIIGSSHYVSAPAYGFYELSACDPAPAPDRDGTAIPLEPDRPSRRLVFETDALRCETVVDHRPLSAFPRDRLGEFDLAYTFGGDPDAVTTIEIGEDGYETVHTYPEFDLALYTQTVFTDIPATDRRERAADESATPPEPPDVR